MECKNEHFRQILLFYFLKGKNAAQTVKKLRDMYGEKALKFGCLLSSAEHIERSGQRETARIGQS